MNEASNGSEPISSLLARDAGGPAGGLLWVRGTLRSVFFGPGGANWGVFGGTGRRSFPEVPASSNLHPRFINRPGQNAAGPAANSTRGQVVLPLALGHYSCPSHTAGKQQSWDSKPEPLDTKL